MKKHSRFSVVLMVLIFVFVSSVGCGIGDFVAFSTSTPTLTSTPTATLTSTATLTPTATMTPTSTATPLPTATQEMVVGIDEPLTVEETDILIYEVNVVSEYLMGGKPFSPQNPNDVLVVVRAKSKNNCLDVHKWDGNINVFLESDATSDMIPWGVVTTNDKIGPLCSIDWLFAAPKSTKSLKIVFIPSGQEVILDSFLK